MLPIKIIATSMIEPSHHIQSEAIDRENNLPIGTIEKYSGLQARYFFDKEDSLSTIAARAIKKAIKSKNIVPESIDLVIAASAVPEQALPFSAANILAKLNVKLGTPGFDVNTSCLGFLTALHIAANFLANNVYQRIAIVSTEFASRGIDWSNLESSAIFGDGCAAVIVEKGDDDHQMLRYLMKTYPEGYEYCQIKAGGSSRNDLMGIDHSDYYFSMQGKPLFKLASEYVDPFIEELFEPLSFNMANIDWVVCHQASHLSLKHIAKKLKIHASKIINIYHQYGNQVSASLPTALHIAYEHQKIQKGQTILLIGTGAGICWGAMILKV